MQNVPHMDPAETIRAALSARPGWRRRVRGAASVALEGTRWQVIPLARRGSGVALLCRPPLGAPLPPRAQRRRIQLALADRHPALLLGFADGARGADLVWSWREPVPGLPSLYRESPSPPDRFPPPAPRASRTARDPVLDAALLARPARVLGLRESPPADLAGAVQRAVEELEDPARLRVLWRILPRVAALDPRCRGAGWLLRAAAVLEPVHRACLERMASMAADHDVAGRIAGRTRRALGDFRATLLRAGAGDDARRRFVRERLVLHSLCGAAPGERSAARVRARLAEHAWGEPALGARLAGCVRVVPAPRSAATGRPGGGGEALEAVERAALTLRRQHLRLDAGALETAAGLQALHAARADHPDAEWWGAGWGRGGPLGGWGRFAIVREAM